MLQLKHSQTKEFIVGIMVANNEERSKLQERISADLRERSRATSKDEDVDLVEDSEYLKGTKKTGKFSWFWFVLVGLIIFAVILLFVVKPF